MGKAVKKTKKQDDFFTKVKTLSDQEFSELENLARDWYKANLFIKQVGYECGFENYEFHRRRRSENHTKILRFIGDKSLNTINKVFKLFTEMMDQEQLNKKDPSLEKYRNAWIKKMKEEIKYAIAMG